MKPKIAFASVTDRAAAQSYFLYDGLGSTANLTNASGTTTGTYSYDVFGAIRSQSGTAGAGNEWRFTRNWGTFIASTSYGNRCDFDDDEWSDGVEVTIRMGNGLACASTTAQNDEADDGWPADLDDDRAVSFGDIGQLTSVFGQSVPPAPARRDIGPDPPDGVIGFADIGRLTQRFGRSC